MGAPIEGLEHHSNMVPRGLRVSCQFSSYSSERLQDVISTDGCDFFSSYFARQKGATLIDAPTGIFIIGLPERLTMKRPPLNPSVTY